MWVFYALLSAFFASLTAIFAKIGVKDVNTDLATAIRTVVILVLAWSIAFFRGGTNSFHTITKHSLLFLVLSGLATGMSWIFYFKALQLGNVSQVAPIDKLSVALTIILAVVILKEPINAKEILGAGLIVAGSLVLIWK
jgi:transporter family protein